MIGRTRDWHALVRRFVLGELGSTRSSRMHCRSPHPAGCAPPCQPRTELEHSHDRPTAAVIGSGVAGLTSAHLLQRRYDVTLFEADNRLGGHAHTHEVPTPDGGRAYVDTGFIVHNERTYPLLLRLFAELGVATQESDMSMSVRCDGCGLEYAGARGPGGLFPQASNLARPAYLRMLGEVLRFHRHARRMLADDRAGDVSLGAFLAIGGYSRYFVEHFMLPWLGPSGRRARLCRWAIRRATCSRFSPTTACSRSAARPKWRTVVGGSHRYVELAVKSLTAVYVATPVRAVTRIAGGIEVRDDADAVHHADRVVIATHPGQALALLADPTPDERDVLGAFCYAQNLTQLHHDTSVLPRRVGARASWNYLKPACSSTDVPVLVSYDMNRLQRLAEPDDYVVTLNGADRVDQDRVLATLHYEHPVYTAESVPAQRRLPLLNDGTVAFAGAYRGWGFHEDGCAAGVRAAASLGAGW